jgi:hypothetical protein
VVTRNGEHNSPLSQLPPGEISNISDHNGESGSELKSEQSESSFSAFPLGRMDWQSTHKSAPGWTNSENLPTQIGPSHQGKTELNNP